MNLLNNAAKFTPEGGNIAIAIEAVGDEVEIRVRDDGPGITEELRPHIFDSFVQGSQSLARSEGGLGIGLALVRTFVGLHGGSVCVRAGRNDTGAEFIITLPLLVMKPPQDEELLAAPSPRRLRVALVEDNEDARRPLRYLLQADGHEVLEAGNGPDGLALLLSEQPDIALIDIGLPGMSGYEVVTRLRKESTGRRPRLLAVTGYGRPEDEDAAEAAGFDGHIVKPICLDKLRECLDECKQAIAQLSGERHDEGCS